LILYTNFNEKGTAGSQLNSFYLIIPLVQFSYFSETGHTQAFTHPMHPLWLFHSTVLLFFLNNGFIIHFGFVPFLLTW